MAKDENTTTVQIIPNSTDATQQIENLERAETRGAEAQIDDLIAKTPKRKWISYIWDSLDKSPEERRLVFKLDCALLTIASLGYFIKYLDQTNINNAFVSGMKEDLSLYGNELNYMQTCWSVGYVLGGLPSNMLLTRVRPSIFIPCIELTWSILTMCLCRCNSATQIYVVRFFVGLFESALYPGMIYIIGSWYRSDELAKRTCIFQMSSAIATMFSGYLMTAVYNLGGVGGLKGWQWLFIIDGVISLPVAIAGFFVLPDLPEISRAWYLTKDEIALSRRRMQIEGRAERAPYTMAKMKKIFTSWRWLTLVPLYVCWNNGGASGQPVFAQFLKNSKSPKYSIAQINTYPTTTNGLQVFATMVFAWTSDGALKGRRWPAIVIGGTFNIICYASLWYWNISFGWRWTCYVLMGVGAALAGIIMSWAHEICSDDNEERAIVTGSMNQMAYVFQIWLPLLVWQQVEAPKYSKGFATVLFLSIGMLGMTAVTWCFRKREFKQKLAALSDGLQVDEKLDNEKVISI